MHRWQDESGDINLAVVAVALPIFILLIGAAVDIARIPLAQMRMQNALRYAAANLNTNWNYNVSPETQPFPNANGQPVSTFGLEPFLPAAYPMVKEGALPRQQLEDALGNSACIAIDEFEENFLCSKIDSGGSQHTSGTSHGVPSQLSEKAVSMIFNQIGAEQDLGVAAAFWRVEVNAKGHIWGVKSKYYIGQLGGGYSFHTMSGVPQVWDKLKEVIPAENSIKEPGKLIVEFTRRWGIAFPAPKTQAQISSGEVNQDEIPSGQEGAWEILGLCENPDLCGSIKQQRYIPPAFLTIIAIKRLRSFFGTYAIFGGSNEKWLFEYYLFPLQNIYNYSAKYWTPE